jgi:hypothetical protein
MPRWHDRVPAGYHGVHRNTEVQGSAMQRYLVRQLRRLAWLDARLASTGVCVTHAAKRLKASDKTIRRELDLLHELSPLVYVEDDQFGRRRWFYADRRRRLFSEWFAGRNRK